MLETVGFETSSRSIYSIGGVRSSDRGEFSRGGKIGEVLVLFGKIFGGNGAPV